MKKIIILSIIFIGSFSYAQLLIGVSQASSDAVCLEFGNSGNRGFGLPMVNKASQVNGPNGTMIYDLNDKKVKIKISGTWMGLSEAGNTDHLTDVKTGKDENTEAKISIGTPDNSTDGILVLEETTKVMVLPQVENPDESIEDPTPGLMVYDPAKKLLAVFNGKDWSYWGAE